MCLTESRSHAVESEWQGRQEAQSLPGWAVGDVLSSMPRCPPADMFTSLWGPSPSQVSSLWGQV